MSEQHTQVRKKTNVGRTGVVTARPSWPTAADIDRRRFLGGSLAAIALFAIGCGDAVTAPASAGTPAGPDATPPAPDPTPRDSAGSAIFRTPAAPNDWGAQARTKPTVTGRGWTVNNNADFDAALSGFAPGDEIVIGAGARLSGNFMLPARN